LLINLLFEFRTFLPGHYFLTADSSENALPVLNHRRDDPGVLSQLFLDAVGFRLQKMTHPSFLAAPAWLVCVLAIPNMIRFNPRSTDGTILERIWCASTTISQVDRYGGDCDAVSLSAGTGLAFIHVMDEPFTGKYHPIS
jgi:hypothetical protein